ncbi:MAG: ferritin family protein [Chitinispirillaceae bacterium]|nr:ferritin family protein [Chitinispirillaceae bacterium]
MPITFNVDEVFTLAEQIERNGAAFYRKCAEISMEEKDFLLNLASMEEGHLATFQQMHQSVTSRESDLSAADPDREAGEYLNNMAGGYVFDTRKDPSATLSGSERLPDILQTAIGLEKDSIVFYLGIKEMVPRSAGKEKIDAIIKEEMKHVTMLSAKLKETTGA